MTVVFESITVFAEQQDSCKKVNRAGFEPATSALSRQRSKPAELTVRLGKYKKKIYNSKISNDSNLPNSGTTGLF